MLGFANGLEGANISADVEKCLQASQPLMQDVQDVVNGLAEKSIAGLEKAIAAMSDAVKEYQASIHGCST